MRATTVASGRLLKLLRPDGRGSHRGLSDVSFALTQRRRPAFFAEKFVGLAAKPAAVSVDPPDSNGISPEIDFF
jgi:hypothetical protein